MAPAPFHPAQELLKMISSVEKQVIEDPNHPVPQNLAHVRTHFYKQKYAHSRKWVSRALS